MYQTISCLKSCQAESEAYNGAEGLGRAAHCTPLAHPIISFPDFRQRQSENKYSFRQIYFLLKLEEEKAVLYLCSEDLFGAVKDSLLVQVSSTLVPSRSTRAAAGSYE